MKKVIVKGQRRVVLKKTYQPRKCCTTKITKPPQKNE